LFQGIRSQGIFPQPAKASYASLQEAGAQVLEFREMIRSFHQAGLEVVLDLVFYHTAEGDELGPPVTLGGIDNSIYYWLDDDKRFYRDFTGTGQTINASHPVVHDLILEDLRYWGNAIVCRWLPFRSRMRAWPRRQRSSSGERSPVGAYR
jgi:hypothetical protein